MYTYRNLIFGYATALIFSSAIINAQEARPLNEISQEQQNQFTGTRTAPTPQKLKNVNAEQRAPVIQNAAPQQPTSFSGNRETVRPAPASVQVQPGAPQQYTGNRETVRPSAPTSVPVQVQQAAPQQFTGNREASAPAKVTKLKKEKQKAPAINVSPSSTTPSTVFGGNRQTPQQVQTVKAQPQIPTIAAPLNVVKASNLHQFDINRQFVGNTQIARQRPVVVHNSLPQTIIINQRSAVCPYVTLTPYAIAKKGNYLELSDGSIWKVRHRDRSKVKKWKATDAIVIETGKFFSWYAYSLVNYSRNESIDVELHLQEDLNGSTSHWIVEVNPYQGYVRLENGSIWRMSTSELAAWSQNDDVIIGLSKDWFSSHYNYVLINPKAKSRFTATFEF